MNIDRALKKFLFALTISMSITTLDAYSITIVMKGNWTTQCGSETVSTHNRYDKALESAINQHKDCDIIPPIRIEVRQTKGNQTIELTWDIPTEREDGSKIQSIDRFNLYVYFNNVLQNVIEVAGDTTIFKLSEVKTGNYSFQISTVEDGIEGARSGMIYQVIE